MAPWKFNEYASGIQKESEEINSKKHRTFLHVDPKRLGAVSGGVAAIGRVRRRLDADVSPHPAEVSELIKPLQRLLFATP
jgi:hypothetical protein